MKRQYSIEIGPAIKFLALPLMITGMFLNSACAVAQDPIPFNAMMQSASTQTVPPRPDANGASGQQVNPGHITKAGKTEFAVGFLLLGAGVLTISATALFNSSGFKASGAKTPALYAGGAGAAGVGVTLIAFGFISGRPNDSPGLAVNAATHRSALPTRAALTLRPSDSVASGWSLIGK